MYGRYGLLALSNARVLRISVPEYDDVDEYEARLLLAVELYREDRLTLKQAAELAELCIEDFMKELSRRRVSIINWDEDELRKELRSVEDLVREARG